MYFLNAGNISSHSRMRQVKNLRGSYSIGKSVLIGFRMLIIYICILIIVFIFLCSDGVSEGQFSQVLLHEMTAIRKACASLENGYLPRVTFVVVQKRHHTRLFPAQHGNRDTTDRSGNIQPGFSPYSALYQLLFVLIMSTYTILKRFFFFASSYRDRRGY